MPTLLSAILMLVPVLFVLALGYWAGRAKQLDRDQVNGLNALVLEYALPASLFVGIVTTPRSALLATSAFVVALLIAGVGLYVGAIVLSVAVVSRYSPRSTGRNFRRPYNSAST